jgi:hypothetical protein
MLPVARPTLKPVRAAARLAGVYAAGVAILMLSLVVTVGFSSGILATIFTLGLPVSLCFAIAFVLFATGRRAGFTALWLLLLALRAWVIVSSPYAPPPGEVFLLWSLFAAPLYAINMTGFESASKLNAISSSRWRHTLGSCSVWATWAVMAVAGLASPSFIDYGRGATRLLWAIAQTGWLALPAGLTIAAIFRARRGVCPVTSDA